MSVRVNGAAAATIPTPPSGKAWVFLNSDTGALSYKNDAGVVTAIALTDPELLALAGLTSAADKLPYFTGSGTAGLADFTAAARALLDDANAAAMLVTLGAAPLASPTFSGTPAAPTASGGTNTTQIATTAFVTAAVAGGGVVSSVFGRTGAVVKAGGDYAVADVTGAAPLASPALTGTPTAPTPGAADNSTKLATTAYVDSAVLGGGASDAALSTSDITTNNVSTTKHGFAPKAPNDAAKFLDGTGAYSTPSVATGSLPAWLATHPDAPPSVADPMDDEFDTDNVGTLWTWRNQGAATFGVANGCGLLTDPGGAGQLKIIEQTLPAGTAYKFRTKLFVDADSAQQGLGGLVVVDSSSGKLEFIDFGYSSGFLLLVQRFTTVSTFNSNPATGVYIAPRPLYLEVERSGGNLLWRYSFTGVEGSFRLLFTSSIAAWITTPDKVGLFLNTVGSGAVIPEWFRRLA